MVSPWLTDKEAAAYLRVCENTLTKWRMRKRGPKYTKLGFHKTAPIRYRLADLEAWMQKLEHKPRETA